MFLFNFDIEEFDMPFEYGKSISFEEQMAISSEGTMIILDLLKAHDIKSTFFCTAVFALNNPSLIQRIVNEGHEIASHAYHHSKFETADLLRSKLVLEEVTGRPVAGFRMPRMMPVNEKELFAAGYFYNSSLNPTWLPGRYNHLDKPRTMFYKDNVLQLPASVGPHFRLPLFWLSFHNLPLWYYKWLCKETFRKDGYVNLYFHPWEFTQLRDKEKFGFPSYISRNSGEAMRRRMDELIRYFKSQDYCFSTISDFLKCRSPFQCAFFATKTRRHEEARRAFN